MTTKAILIEKSEMEAVFRFDPVTNVLERKYRGLYWRAANVNQRKDGYSRVNFNRRNIYIHRLIYTLIHGNIDEDMHIDHWDGNPENNNLSNLQPLSHRDNLAKSRSGVNPYLNASRGKYQVQVNAWFGEKRCAFYLGYFKEKTDAQLLCDAYDAKFGYGKPDYSVRLGTYEEWIKCMKDFRIRNTATSRPPEFQGVSN